MDVEDVCIYIYIQFMVIAEDWETGIFALNQSAAHGC